MGRPSTLTEADYLQVVNAFTEVGGKNVSAVQRITGRSRQLITELWEEGKPKLGMPPIALRFGKQSGFSDAIPGTSGTSSTPVEAKSASADGPAPASASESTIAPAPHVGQGATTTPAPAPSPPNTSPNGLSPKQAAARQREEDAILSGVQNLLGVSVTMTEIVKVVRDEAQKLGAIVDQAERRNTLKELTALLVQLGRVSATTSEGLTKVMTAGRLNAGQPGTIGELRHTGTVGVVPAVSEDPAEREARIAYFLDIHARSRAHVPGEYKGEEAGIIDVTPEVVEAAASVPTSAALVSLRDVTVETVKPMGGDAGDAEENLRRALAARSMPAANIDRLIDRLRARCEQAGGDLAAIFEAALAAPPGQAN